MAKFGAKTIATLIKDLTNDPLMSALEAAGNASIRMKSTEALALLAPGLKQHKGIKTLNLTECEITDPGCEVLADILANNHVIEEVILEKNKITSVGAIQLADGLAKNTGVRTLNLLQQEVTSFGDKCLDHFVKMYSTNVTLTKMTWRLDSRKSFLLAKLQTRNVEIQKAKAAGKEFSHLLPDNLRPGPREIGAQEPQVGDHEQGSESARSGGYSPTVSEGALEDSEGASTRGGDGEDSGTVPLLSLKLGAAVNLAAPPLITPRLEASLGSLKQKASTSRIDDEKKAALISSLQNMRNVLKTSPPPTVREPTAEVLGASEAVVTLSPEIAEEVAVVEVAQEKDEEAS